jgi:hypothetical protein
MKLASHYLQEIAGIEIYPLISFIIFFTFFILLLIWVFSIDKNYMKKMASYAIDPEDLDEETDITKLKKTN